MTAWCLGACRVLCPLAGTAEAAEGSGSRCSSVSLSVSAVRTFCRVPTTRNLEERPEQRGPVHHGAQRPIASGHSPPELFSWSRPLWGPLVPPYVVKLVLENESCLRALDRARRASLCGIARIFTHRPDMLRVSVSCTVATHWPPVLEMSVSYSVFVFHTRITSKCVMCQSFMCVTKINMVQTDGVLCSPAYRERK